MIIVLMGVSGSGKTTIGRRLARDLGWRFLEGDDYHPQDNIRKMHQGTPLKDQDRWPWLDTLGELITDMVERGESAILVCSALKRAYRNRLKRDDVQVRFVYLHGSFELIKQRMEERQGHFFKAGLLKSQFDLLEESDAIPQVDISQNLDVIVAGLKELVGS